MGIKIEGLADAIMHELQIYTREVVEEMNAAGDRIAKDGAKKLRQVSPKRTGKYAKGWRVKKETAFRKPTGYIIYNKDQPSLPHLLEHGHATRDGGRTQPQVHIKPVEEEVVEQYVKAVEEAIKGG